MNLSITGSQNEAASAAGARNLRREAGISAGVQSAPQDYSVAAEQSSAALPWLDVKGAAERAGISEGYCCTLLTSGRIRSVKVGRLRRVRPEWVDEWLAGGRA